MSNETKFWNWLVQSSSDPEKVSLTVKGFLSGAIPLALIVLHLIGADSITGPALQQAIDGVGAFVVAGLALVSAGITAYGFIRKLFNTAKA